MLYLGLRNEYIVSPVAMHECWSLKVCLLTIKSLHNLFNYMHVLLWCLFKARMLCLCMPSFVGMHFSIIITGIEWHDGKMIFCNFSKDFPTFLNLRARPGPRIVKIGENGLVEIRQDFCLTHVYLVDPPILINWTSPFPILGVSGVLFHFYSISNRYSCLQTVKTLIKRRILRRLIWICTICLCSKNGMLGLYGLKIFLHSIYIFHCFGWIELTKAIKNLI